MYKNYLQKSFAIEMFNVHIEVLFTVKMLDSGFTTITAVSITKRSEHQSKRNVNELNRA